MLRYLEIINFGQVLFRTTHEKYEIFPQGETLYAVDKKSFKHIRDVTYDLYNPWTGSTCDGEGRVIQLKCHTSSRRVSMHEGRIMSDDEGDLWFKLVQNRHPKTPSLYRKVFFVYNEMSELQSDVYYLYHTDIDVVPHITLRRRKIFSLQLEINAALENRTKPQAKSYLRSRGVEVNTYELTSACRSVPTHKKLKMGRKPATDVAKLYDKFASSSNCLEKIEPLQLDKIDDKVAIVQIVTYPLAFKHLSASLPNFRELQDHKSKIEHLTDLNELESDVHLRRYLTQVNTSGSLSMIGSTIIIDTTFGICSGEYVTIAVGVTDQFTSKASGKSGSFLLGFMIHTTKNSENHEKFSKTLNDRLYEASSIKRVPSVIHDGESSFRVYTTGRILKDATPLRCQVHRAKNLKSFFKSSAEFDDFKVRLFGQTVESPSGSTLKAGVLNTISFENYEERMNILIQSCENENLKNWLNRNMFDLFEYDSLYSRLRGGWIVHWLSTNLIEGRNAHLKTLVPSPLLAHSLIDVFLTLHEDEVKNRIAAVSGNSTLLATRNVVPNYEYLSDEEKKSVLSLFGLDDYIVENEFAKFPQWLSKGDGRSDSSIVQDIAGKLQVNKCGSDSNIFFIECLDRTLPSSRISISKIIKKDAELICTHSSCQKHKDYSFFFCVHMLAVFRLLRTEEQQECFMFLDHKRNERTFMNVRYRTQKPMDGTKFKNRIGKQLSQGNHTRALQGFYRSSLDNILDGSYNDDEDDNIYREEY